MLTQRDFMLYNLLAEVRSESDVAITGVIDWDSAVIAPPVEAFKPPFWFWDKDDEETVDFPHMSEQAGILKQTFENIASEEYKLFAFRAKAELASCMYRILG